MLLRAYARGYVWYVRRSYLYAPRCAEAVGGVQSGTLPGGECVFLQIFSDVYRYDLSRNERQPEQKERKRARCRVSIQFGVIEVVRDASEESSVAEEQGTCCASTWLFSNSLVLVFRPASLFEEEGERFVSRACLRKKKTGLGVQREARMQDPV